jgi:hypothetical protein
MGWNDLLGSKQFFSLKESALNSTKLSITQKNTFPLYFYQPSQLYIEHPNVMH